MLADHEYSNEELRKMCIDSPELYETVKAALTECDQHGNSKIWLGSLVQDTAAHTQIQLVVTRNSDEHIDEN